MPTLLIVFFAAIFWGALAYARDLGQWENSDPKIKAWFQSLRQPTDPGASCCGESDAYYADSFEVNTDGDYVAIITDERDDAPLRRPHIDVGTKIVVPKERIKFDQGNPTGHGIIFVAAIRQDNKVIGGIVYCYLPPGGV